MAHEPPFLVLRDRGRVAFYLPLGEVIDRYRAAKILMRQALSADPTAKAQVEEILRLADDERAPERFDSSVSACLLSEAMREIEFERTQYAAAQAAQAAQAQAAPQAPAESAQSQAPAASGPVEGQPQPMPRAARPRPAPAAADENETACAHGIMASLGCPMCAQDHARAAAGNGASRAA